MYMPWSTNLVPYFRQNIADIETAIEKNILGNNRFIVFFMSSPTRATLFELKYKKGTCVRDTLDEYVYTDPVFTTAAGITSILNDVIDIAPANRYSMIISSHGMAWIPVSASRTRGFKQKEYWEYEGVPSTRWFGGTSSEHQVDITTLAEGITAAGIKMEYILFDDCYMSSIEVAYDLKEVAHYLIGCPTEIMAYGFPYAIITPHLIGNVDYHNLCNDFIAFYENYSTPCGTIGVTDCSQVENLALVMKEINRQYPFDPALLNSIQRMCGYSPVRFFDLGDYVSKLCPDGNLLSVFKAQLERTVPLRGHTAEYYSASIGSVPIQSYSGVTTSDPSTSPSTSLKTETAWYKATH